MLLPCIHEFLRHNSLRVISKFYLSFQELSCNNICVRYGDVPSTSVMFTFSFGYSISSFSQQELMKHMCGTHILPS
jgi:hypothetical protein